MTLVVQASATRIWAYLHFPLITLKLYRGGEGTNAFWNGQRDYVRSSKLTNGEFKLYVVHMLLLHKAFVLTFDISDCIDLILKQNEIE